MTAVVSLAATFALDIMRSSTESAMTTYVLQRRSFYFTIGVACYSENRVDVYWKS